MDLIEQLKRKIEAWIVEYEWDNNDIGVSVEIDKSPCYYEVPDNIDIILEKAGTGCYVFSCSFNLYEDLTTDDAISGRNTIYIKLKSIITCESMSEVGDDSDEEIEKWTIDDEYTVTTYVDASWDQIDSMLTSVERNEYAANLEKAGDIIKELANISSSFWFRGHADIRWKLKSTAARKNLKKHEIIRLRLEFEKRTSFLQPGSYPLNRAKCVFLMRHHGLPTKIMDWSRSPLVALYFAVQDMEYTKRDGCIWQLKKSSIDDSLNLETLLKCDDTKEGIKDSEKIIPIHSPYTNQRMVNQQSQFVLHQSYEDLGNTDNKKLKKIVIPKETKPFLRTMLQTFGIDRSFVFPDIDNICAQIKEDVLDKDDMTDDEDFLYNEDCNF